MKFILSWQVSHVVWGIDHVSQARMVSALAVALDKLLEIWSIDLSKPRLTTAVCLSEDVDRRLRQRHYSPY